MERRSSQACPERNSSILHMPRKNVLTSLKIKVNEERRKEFYDKKREEAARIFITKPLQGGAAKLEIETGQD